VISEADLDTLSRDPSLPLEVVDRGSFFNVRLKALFEPRPNIESRPMLLVTRRRAEKRSRPVRSRPRRGPLTGSIDSLRACSPAWLRCRTGLPLAEPG
jgi:hypothetical protein